MHATYKFYKPELIPPIHGSNNTGNTCWQNAMTQLIFSCSAFNEYVLKCGDEIKSEYVRIYKKYLEQTLSPVAINKIREECGKQPLITERDRISPENTSTVLLQSFIQDLKRVGRSSQYVSGQQDSPATGLIDLLEAIGDDEVYKYFNNKYEVKTKCGKCNAVTSKLEDKSPMVKMYIDVPIRTQPSMEKWMQFRKEEIRDFNCEKCGEKGINAHRQETLHMLREIIIVNYRLPSPVRFFPDELKFPGVGGKTLNYKKIGQIEWSGGLDAPPTDNSSPIRARNYSYASSGHYWATVMRPHPKSGEFKWFNANDSSVSMIADANENFTASGEFSRANSVMVAYHLFSVTEMTADEKKYFSIG